jgi:hypothetical protein
MRQRRQAKLKAVATELWRRLHHPIPEVGAYLRWVSLGHLRYYAVPMNGPALSSFRQALVRLWRRMLDRRSQRAGYSWARVTQLTGRWLPYPRICHPYPTARFAVTTQGRSRMR